ncbi:hypothetical protein [Corynebacterium bovis]|uniref:hypothetical protein n=1 Tax=Corynebacterium bovis TaxID=36808 RepID=UPI000F64D9AC|nr:hypothetical protein [Corynebacterium bovis]RRO94348.1 hypothetical protein CXF29_07780 [Corynebacterium bovis]RRQ15293.1 hypothetical protein CXF46_08650 [Corynebacterium bovis]
MRTAHTTALRRAATASAAAVLAAATVVGTPAVAGAATPAPVDTTGQKTASSGFGGDFELPQRWNDDYKPGTRCTPPGSVGTYVEAKRRWFKQTDASSVQNLNDEKVPVQHTVTDIRKQATEVSAKGEGEGEIAKYLTLAFGMSYVNEISWKLKQVVGPYDLAPHKKGRLVWGFTMLDVDAQDVRCGDDLVWHAEGKPYHATSPESRYSELQITDNDAY